MVKKTSNIHTYFLGCYQGFESDDVSSIKSVLCLSVCLSALKPTHMDTPRDYP